MQLSAKFVSAAHLESRDLVSHDLCGRWTAHLNISREKFAVAVYFYQRAHTDKFDAAGENTHIYLAMRLASGVIGIHWDTTGMVNLWRTTTLWHRKKLEMVMVRS